MKILSQRARLIILAVYVSALFCSSKLAVTSQKIRVNSKKREKVKKY